MFLAMVATAQPTEFIQSMVVVGGHRSIAIQCSNWAKHQVLSITRLSGIHLDLLYGKLMRGVTSSSVAIPDWKKAANNSTAARREWTVTASVHMVTGSSRTDINKCTLLAKIPWFSLSSWTAELYIFTLIFPQAGGRRGEGTCPWLDSCTPSGPYTRLVDSYRREEESFLD